MDYLSTNSFNIHEEENINKTTEFVSNSDDQVI